MMETLKRKLTSRKLWTAVVGFVTGLLIYNGHSEAEAKEVGSLILMAASVVAYIIGEGLADAGNQQPVIYVPDGDDEKVDE
jgi:hypothetical protein